MPHGKGTYGSKVGRPKKMTKAQAGKTKISGDSRLSDQDVAYIKKMLANLPKAKDRRLSDMDLSQLAGSSRMSDQDLALAIGKKTGTGKKKTTTARKTGGVTTARKGKTKFKGGTSKKARGLMKIHGKDFKSTARKGKAKVGK